MTEAVVARKVAEIRQRTARVRELITDMPTSDALRARRTEAEALILNLYLALQACGDLALHVVADRGLGTPGDARSAFEMLASAAVIDAPLAANLSAATGLRNRIAHQYGTLDLALVHAAASEDLGDLDAFAGAVAGAYRL